MKATHHREQAWRSLQRQVSVLQARAERAERAERDLQIELERARQQARAQQAELSSLRPRA